jgi:rhomboid protease GluP
MSTGTLRDFPATTALLAINLAVFTGMVLTSGSLMEFAPRVLIEWGANVGRLTLSGDYWRLVTAGFVHSGLPHLAFNMWALWSLGRLSERLVGSWITFAVYILTGVGGSLLSLAVNPEQFEVGASGAIFGIAGAILSGIKFGNVPISSIHKRAIFSSLTFFVLFNLAIGFGLVSVGIGIDNMCHLGGLVSGLIFGVPLATASASGKKSFEWATMILGGAIMAVLTFQLVSANVRSNPALAIERALRGQDYTKAIAMLEKLTGEQPSDDQAWAELGYAYQMDNNKEKAITAYEQALKINPNSRVAQKGLQSLRGDAPRQEQ